MTAGFTQEELSVLEEVLKEYLTELRMEIADTDDYDFRQALKKKSEMLQSILGKMEQAKVLTIN